MKLGDHWNIGVNISLFHHTQICLGLTSTELNGVKCQAYKLLSTSFTGQVLFF